jgi:hypothetical protein
MLPPYWLSRPPMTLGEVIGQLEALFHQIAEGKGDWLEEPLPVPKWQFLCWLADHKNVLLHGSGDPNISEFEPRQSNDLAEFGNRKAVYAASDGIWPMFFAIVDRTGYPMTIVNAAIRLESPDGRISDPYYYFALTDSVFIQKPWRQGYVYVLPKAGFEEQEKDRFGEMRVHTHHWASLEAVRPLAKLQVSPEDFPFLEQIRPQNDERVAERARANPDGFPWVE